MTDQTKLYIDSAIKLNDFVIKSKKRRIAYRFRAMEDEIHRLSLSFSQLAALTIGFSEAVDKLTANNK